MFSPPLPPPPHVEKVIYTPEYSSAAINIDMNTTWIGQRICGALVIIMLMLLQGIAGYKGKIPVAVKTLTSRDPLVISKFKEEADLMRKFVHPNIISLLGMPLYNCTVWNKKTSRTVHILIWLLLSGVCTDSEEDDDEDNAPLMILEYMPYGDLKGFLASHKYEPQLRYFNVVYMTLP